MLKKIEKFAKFLEKKEISRLSVEKTFRQKSSGRNKCQRSYHMSQHDSPKFN